MPRQKACDEDVASSWRSSAPKLTARAGKLLRLRVGGMAQTVLRGIERVRARFILTMAACILAKLPRLLAV